MDINNIRKKLFEKKLNILEHIKASADILKILFKENKELLILVFVTILIANGMAYINIKVRDEMFLAIEYNDRDKIETYSSLNVMLTTLIFLFPLVKLFVSGYFYKKLVLKIENRKNNNLKNFYFKMLKLTGVVIILSIILAILIFNVLSQVIVENPFVGVVILRTMAAVVFISYFLYFEAYFVREFDLIDSIKYSLNLSKGNRIKKIMPSIYYFAISIILEKLFFFLVNFPYNVNTLFEILVNIIFSATLFFNLAFLYCLNIAVFLNVEYDYLKRGMKEKEAEKI